MARLVLAHLPIGTAVLTASIFAVATQLARTTNLPDLAACRITARAIIQAPIARHAYIIDTVIITFAQHTAAFNLVKAGRMIAILCLLARDTATVAFRHAHAIITSFTGCTRDATAIPCRTTHIIAANLIRIAHHAAAIPRRTTHPIQTDLGRLALRTVAIPRQTTNIVIAHHVIQTLNAAAIAIPHTAVTLAALILATNLAATRFRADITVAHFVLAAHLAAAQIHTCILDALLLVRTHLAPAKRRKLTLRTILFFRAHVVATNSPIRAIALVFARIAKTWLDRLLLFSRNHSVAVTSPSHYPHDCNSQTQPMFHTCLLKQINARSFLTNSFPIVKPRYLIIHKYHAFSPFGARLWPAAIRRASGFAYAPMAHTARTSLL